MKRKQDQNVISFRELNEAPWLARMACASRDEQDLRHCPRKAVNMHVSLNQCMTCYGSGAIRDLSLHGAFIEIADQGLSAGMSVQIGFPFLFAGLPIERRLSARVLRIEPKGVALQFHKYNPDFYNDLFSLLGSE